MGSYGNLKSMGVVGAGCFFFFFSLASSFQKSSYFSMSILLWRISEFHFIIFFFDLETYIIIFCLNFREKIIFLEEDDIL